MLEAIWLYCKNLQNLENLDFFEILITQKLRNSEDPDEIPLNMASNQFCIDTRQSNGNSTNDHFIERRGHLLEHRLSITSDYLFYWKSIGTDVHQY